MGKGFFSRQTDDNALIAEVEQRLQTSIEALCKRVETLETEIALLKSEMAKRAEAETKMHVEQPKPAEEIPAIARQNERTLYLAAPNSDGSFSSFSAQEVVGTSIYRLETTDGKNGEFSFLNTPDALATALISVTQFLKPVCKVSGKVSFMPRRITTESKGRATFDGVVWTMTQKAIVKFED